MFLKGFLLNAINIGVLFFWIGLIIVVGPSLNGDSTRFVLFFSALLLIYFLTDILKIILSKRLKKQLTTPIIYNLKKAVSAIIIVCGIVLIFKGFLPNKQIDPPKIIIEIQK